VRRREARRAARRRLDLAERAERRAGPVGAEGALDDEQLAERERPVERRRGADTDRARQPSATSSSSTTAADGPPTPVAWIVIGSPSAA